MNHGHRCIISRMKTLALVLLLATVAQAQTLADAARKERERQAHLKSTRVIVAKGTPAPSTAPAKETQKPAAGSSTEPSAKETPAPSTAATTPEVTDPVKEWNDQVEKLKARIQELQDQETALQLQVNQVTNQFLAPVADQDSRAAAQAQLGETQSRLAAVQTELEQNQKTLDEMQAQGPPTK